MRLANAGARISTALARCDSAQRRLLERVDTGTDRWLEALDTALDRERELKFTIRQVGRRVIRRK